MIFQKMFRFEGANIFDKKTLAMVQDLSLDAVYEIEPKQAREFFDDIYAFTSKYKKELIERPEIYQKYLNIQAKMFWLGFQAVDEKLRNNLISSYLVLGLQQGLNPLNSFKRYLDLFESNFVPDNESRNAFLFSLMNNEERIGSQMILLSTGEKVASTVKNWLKNYISTLPASSKISGGFDKVSYLTNNQNAKTLTAAEKEILSKIIDIYRFLKYPQASNSTIRIKQSERESLVSKQPVTPKVPLPSAPVIQPVERIAAKPEAMGFKSEFEQKLAAAGTVHGSSLSELKAKIEETVVKNEGEPLVSKMTMAVKPSIRMTPQEIKREVDTPELVGHLDGKVTFPAPKTPARVIVRPSIALVDIKVVDDLKKIEVANLRDGELAGRIKEIKSKIISLAVSNNLLPFYTVLAFEQSPLFKAYMLHGSNKVEGAADAGGPASPDPSRRGRAEVDASQGGLTQEEFEALADLRKEVERL